MQSPRRRVLNIYIYHMYIIYDIYICILPLETRAWHIRAWSIPAPSTHVAHHAVSLIPFIVMTLAFENNSICRCYGLSRLYLLFVVVIALDVSLRRPELCVGGVVMKVRALRWTCGYGGQRSLFPTRFSSCSSQGCHRYSSLADGGCRWLGYRLRCQPFSSK